MDVRRIILTLIKNPRNKQFKRQRGRSITHHWDHAACAWKPLHTLIEGLTPNQLAMVKQLKGQDRIWS